MPRVDLVGRRFGRLVVLKRDGNVGTRSRWLCRCDCGSVVLAGSGSLLSDWKKSCGCLQREANIARSVHGHARTGHHSVEYKTWCGMRRRCTNSNERSWPRYGGRGIRVCERWNSFELFLLDMGPKPSPQHSIDRIDPDGNYEPSNCRWATLDEQNRNKRLTMGVVHRSLIRHLYRRGVGVMALAHAFGASPKTINRNLEGLRG